MSTVLSVPVADCCLGQLPTVWTCSDSDSAQEVENPVSSAHCTVSNMVSLLSRWESRERSRRAEAEMTYMIRSMQTRGSRENNAPKHGYMLKYEEPKDERRKADQP